MNPDPNCKLCDGSGWVCEDHEDMAWKDGDGCCGGAGEPCICHPLHPMFKAPRIYETGSGTS